MSTPASSRDRLEAALARIADPAGEGAKACLTTYTAAARAAADAADARARTGISLGPLDGAVVSIKDLFDVAGEPTRAGSKVLADATPATADAAVVRRLRAAGAVSVAKTNMTEFAFSGVGTNPHYGTPGNPADRSRIPGGSSSGAAVAVADGMCEIGVGTDTGGSTRIPAALCGIVGFKPSRQRVPTAGAFPLSFTLDSVGPLARSVVDCAKADAVLAGEAWEPPSPSPLAGLRVGLLQGLPLQGMDATVAARYAEAVAALGRAGVRLADTTTTLLDDMARLNAKGGLIAPEAYAIHRAQIESRPEAFDPFVRVRVERGGGIPAADYVDLLRERAQLLPAMDAALAEFDVVAWPTTPIVAPALADVATADDFNARNLMLLRNTTIVNFFDLCALSLPLPRAGGLPTGFMLVARNGADQRLLRVAAAVERLLAA